VAAIAGFGAAAAAAASTRHADALRMAALRDRFEKGLKAISPQAVIFGEKAARLPNTSLFAVPGIKAETAIISLDLNGIAVSSGAACSSGKVQVSHVLAAMGVEPALARGALRVSLGWTSSENDVDMLLNAWKRVASSLLKNHADAA
jgi:cysteine desulfurase